MALNARIVPLATCIPTTKNVLEPLTMKATVQNIGTSTIPAGMYCEIVCGTLSVMQVTSINLSPGNSVVFGEGLTNIIPESWAGQTKSVTATVWENILKAKQLDTYTCSNLLTVKPSFVDIDNITGISHNVTKGRCNPGVLFSWSQTEKENAFVTKIGEWQMRYPTSEVAYDDYAVENEMIATMIKFYNFGSNYNTNLIFRWYRLADNNKIFEWTYTIPSAESQGYARWDWYASLAWIGKYYLEINGGGIYRCEITASGGPISGTANVYFNVLPPAPPSPAEYEEVPSYTGKCPPSGGICIGFPDGYVWDIYGDAITGWADGGYWEGHLIKIAKGYYKWYYHILNTNYRKTTSA